jgi:hypothetical protein
MKPIRPMEATCMCTVYIFGWLVILVQYAGLSMKLSANISAAGCAVTCDVISFKEIGLVLRPTYLLAFKLFLCFLYSGWTGRPILTMVT